MMAGSPQKLSYSRVNKGTNLRVLSVFTLAMINVAAIASLRNLPMMAEYGLALVFYLTLSGLFFFIPTALVSAELATGWPKTGGVYVWVKEGLGPRWGFLAIWLQWVTNVVWLPTVLSFIAATIAYIINPELAENKTYTLTIVLVGLWGATFLNFRGMKLSGFISSTGAIFGTLVPGALIIILGFAWLFKGGSTEISFTAQGLIPDMGNIKQLVLIAGILLGLAGMEMSAVHAQEVKDPRRNYPKAILLSTVVIMALFIIGSLSIAIVVPNKEISLVAGVMEAFEKFFAAYNIMWLVPIFAVLIAFGAFAQVSTWIVGPTKGLAATGRNGDLPPFFQHLNRNAIPTNILIVQALIVTLFSLVILLMPTVSSSYWILTALTALVYLSMYLLMFISAIRLRYTRPDTPRPYKIPGGNFGMWLVAGVGILASAFAMFIGFFPPAQLESGNKFFYVAFLVIGLAVLCLTPILIYHFRKPSWVAPQTDQEPD